MISVRQGRFSDIETADNLCALLEEYSAECGNSSIGVPTIQLEMYRAMEAQGNFIVICAFDGETLVGFVNIVIATLPHYGKLMAATESFFVSKDFRAGGAGSMLLKEAECVATERGAKAILVSAPTESQFAQMLCGKKSYIDTNRVFTKCLP